MGVGVSIVVAAIGAILRFATTVHSSSFNIQTIGDILMAVGAVGFVVSVVAWFSWGWSGFRRRQTTVYRDPGDDGFYGSPIPGHPGYYRTPDGRTVYQASGGRTVVEERERGY